MSNALISLHESQTYSPTIGFSMLRDSVGGLEFTTINERVPAVRVQLGATHGNLPTIFSTPLGAVVWITSVDRPLRNLTAREDAVVHRAILRTAQLVSKGRLLGS